MRVPLNVMHWGEPDAPRTVVALHGITANAGAWSRPGRLLAAAGWRVIAPDMRGHGESARGDGDFSFEALLGDFAAAVPAEPDVLIGHSFGGTLAQLGVLSGVFRPRAVLLEDPVSHFADKATPMAMLGHDEANLPRTVDGLLALNPGWAPIDAAWKVASLFQIDFDDARAAFAGNAPWDLRPRSREVAAKQPTVWILPDVSRFVPEDDQARLKREVGERAVVVVPGVGHSIHRDALEAFCDVVVRLGDGTWFAP
jgi:pimeloyl-ACP methyl ester carboxylesterase